MVEISIKWSIMCNRFYVKRSVEIIPCWLKEAQSGI